MLDVFGMVWIVKKNSNDLTKSCFPLLITQVIGILLENFWNKSLEANQLGKRCIFSKYVLTTHQLQPKYLESVTARCTFPEEFLTSSSQTPSFICIDQSFFDSWNMGCFDNFMAAQHNGKTDFFHDEEEVSSPKSTVQFPLCKANELSSTQSLH